MGQWLGSTTTHDNKQVLAYTSESANKSSTATQGTNGWQTDMVRTGAELASSIEVNVDSQNTPHLVYPAATTPSSSKWPLVEQKG